MADSKAVVSVEAAASSSLLCEPVAGRHGRRGDDDGPLNACTFRHPLGLCRYGDALFVAEYLGLSLRQVDGELGVDQPMVGGRLRRECRWRRPCSGV
jgi:hypothetical protein